MVSPRQPTVGQSEPATGRTALKELIAAAARGPIIDGEAEEVRSWPEAAPEVPLKPASGGGGGAASGGGMTGLCGDPRALSGPGQPPGPAASQATKGHNL
jgi:hypothetical protein